MTINSSTTRDAAQLGVLAALAHDFETWYEAQADPIRKRMLRRRLSEDKAFEVGAVALNMPPSAIFGQYRTIDRELRETAPPAHEDRKQLAEIRCWMRDSLDDLCTFDLDGAVDILDHAVRKLDWLIHRKSRAGSRAYRILDGQSIDRLEQVLVSATTLLTEVTRVRTLVLA